MFCLPKTAWPSDLVNASFQVIVAFDLNWRANSNTTSTGCPTYFPAPCPAAVYDSANKPVVTLTSNCTPSAFTGSGSAWPIDPIQAYRTSANLNLVGANVGTAILGWTPPAVPAVCTLTATLNNQGVQDSMDLFVFLQ